MQRGVAGDVGFIDRYLHGQHIVEDLFIAGDYGGVEKTSGTVIGISKTDWKDR
jgi:hypothetical protein